MYKSMCCFLSLFLLTGCAGKKEVNTAPPVQTSLRDELLLGYKSTTSPCLDGLNANFRNNGCKDFTWQAPKGEQFPVAFKCKEPLPIVNADVWWTQTEFIMWPTPQQVSEDLATHMFCMDGLWSIAIKK